MVLQPAATGMRSPNAPLGSKNQAAGLPAFAQLQANGIQLPDELPGFAMTTVKQSRERGAGEWAPV